MQWYEILSIIADFFAIITFSVFSFHCFISIKQKLPARIQVSYEDNAVPFPIFYVREFQTFIVFMPLKIINKSSPKSVIIKNPSLSYDSNGNIVKVDTESPHSISNLKSVSIFYEKFQYALYGNSDNEISSLSKLIIFPFVITDKTFIKRSSTAFTISFDLANSFKCHIKKEIVLRKKDIGPYPIEKIEKHISQFRPNAYDAGTYEDV